jgi:hypothetical protein
VSDPTEPTEPTERPRPTPDGSARDTADPVDLTDPAEAAASVEPVLVRNVPAPTPPPRSVPRVEVQPSQLVAAAGSAIVTAGRFGRLIGRSGWRVARQLPGAKTVEREAQRLQAYATNEARRILAQPASAPSSRTSAEEQRAVDYIRNTDPGAAPLRSAMNELLERSVEATRIDSRGYLYGTIISQLVPDEARILAAMSDGTQFAAGDVVYKPRRGQNRILVANVSSVGRQAGLVSPDNVPTYLTRLHSFGLVEFGPEDDGFSVQYDILASDQSVQNARKGVEPRRRGSVRLERKSVGLSPFGREFWAASDPSRSMS